MAATADETRVVEGVKTQLFIGGQWRDATGGATLDVEDPATGETIATVADATHRGRRRGAGRGDRGVRDLAQRRPARARRHPAPGL